MRTTIMVTLAAVAAILVACGGSSTSTTAPAGVPTTAPTPPQGTGVPTTVPVTPSKSAEAWALTQVEPVQKEFLDLAIAQDWDKLYDTYSAEDRVGCPRATFISKSAADWSASVPFDIEQRLLAEEQSLNDGTLPITFSEVTTNRITYQIDGDDPFTIELRDDKWIAVDQPLGRDCSKLDLYASTPTPTK